MACLAPGGCHIGFIESNRLPEGSDDACDTNDNGEYLCKGSYWLFNPALGGADPLLGECERLFVNLSDDCTMAQWLELSIPQIVEEANAPTDGVDCCPPGTIWHDSAADSYYISLNVNGSCLWCEICASPTEDPHTSHFAMTGPLRTEWDGVGNLPNSDQSGINIQSVTFTNPSLVRSMAVCMAWGGLNADFSFNSTGPWHARYGVQPEFRINVNGAGDVTLNDRFRLDAFMSRNPEPPGIFEQDYASGGWNHCLTLGPGGNVVVSQEVFLEVIEGSDADLNERIQIESLPITVWGSTI